MVDDNAKTGMDAKGILGNPELPKPIFPEPWVLAEHCNEGSPLPASLPVGSLVFGSKLVQIGAHTLFGTGFERDSAI